MLVVWMIGRDGSLATTVHETGHSQQVGLPLLTIARAVASSGAVWLFMAHSHPSGDPRPSHADIDSTRQVWRLARTLGASLQDHLIIGRHRLFSFRDSGLL